MGGQRTYDDPCGIARALDRVGERWALLLVRELLLGPKRFTDLRRGLPAASPNVLSTRLHELERDGVVRRRRLPPPAATWVYELTERGRGLGPVLMELARWGSRTPITTEAELGMDALMLALLSAFEPTAVAGLDGTFQLRLGEDRFRMRVAEGRLDVARGEVERPDAVLITDAATLRAVAFGMREVAAATADGALVVRGDCAAAARLLEAFPRPTPPE